MTDQIIPGDTTNLAREQVPPDWLEALDVEWCAERAAEALKYLAQHYAEAAGSRVLHSYQDAQPTRRPSSRTVRAIWRPPEATLHEGRQGRGPAAPKRRSGVTRGPNDEERNRRNRNMGTGVGVGIPLGVALGLAMDNLALGIGIGVALGAAIGAALGGRGGGRG